MDHPGSKLGTGLVVFAGVTFLLSGLTPSGPVFNGLPLECSLQKNPDKEELPLQRLLSMVIILNAFSALAYGSGLGMKESIVRINYSRYKAFHDGVGDVFIPADMGSLQRNLKRALCRQNIKESNEIFMLIDLKELDAEAVQNISAIRKLIADCKNGVVSASTFNLLSEREKAELAEKEKESQIKIAEERAKVLKGIYDMFSGVSCRENTSQQAWSFNCTSSAK
jgi:hypothetical protein